MLGITEINQIKKVMNEGIKSNFIAGGNLMVIKDSKEIFYHEDGMSDRDTGVPIRRDTMFRLYSMSKPITAAAAMILLERGELDLYEPVSKYLEGFKNQKVFDGEKMVPVDREVMIKDLLSMTSGLVYPGDGKAGQDTAEVFHELDQRLLGDHPMSTLELANRLGQCALAFQPGTMWQYGTSADVLGAVIEVVSGERFGTFLEKELFGPLKMEDTGFWIPEEKRSRLCKTYGDNGKGGLELYTGNRLGIIQQMDRDPAYEAGGAGLVSTIDDYARFTQMLMNQGTLDGVSILKPRTVEYLTTSTLTADQQKGFDTWIAMSGRSYGNLMRVMTDCGKAGDLGSPGEYGWDGWLGAYFANCPKDDLTILFMIQRMDAGTTTLTRKLRNIIISSCCK